jgi:hypothetical protein
VRQAVHQALAAFFRTRAEPATTFTAFWKEAGQVELRYAQRESWQRLNETGRALLAKFIAEELSRIGKVTTVEKPFELSITGFRYALCWPHARVANGDLDPAIF